MNHAVLNLKVLTHSHDGEGVAQMATISPYKGKSGHIGANIQMPSCVRAISL